MEVTPTPLEWTSDDVANWNNFLATRTGSRLIPKAFSMIPLLLRKGEINEILIRSGEVLGWQGLAQQLLSQTQVEAPVASTAAPSSHLPSLDDDSAWNSAGGLASETIAPKE